MSSTQSTQNTSESRVTRTSDDPRDDHRTSAWSDPKGAGNPAAAVDAKENHYEHNSGQLLLGEKISMTWFAADDLDENASEQRRQLFQRIWRIDRGQDIDPSDPSLGDDLDDYADSSVNTEIVSSFARYKHRLADTCLQQLEVPEWVRNQVLYLIHKRDLVEFNRYGGINGAIVGFTIEALAEFRSLGLEGLKESPWWPDIKSLADEFDIIGATGRQFRQLVDHIKENYELPE